MSRHHLTNEQLWAVVNAPNEMSSQQIADMIGATQSAVHHRRWQLRKHGWSCKVDWTPCPECGKPLIERRRRQIYHDHCRADVSKKLNASYEAERELSAEQLQARDARRDTHYVRAQAETRPHATNHMKRYTQDDDDLLLELSKAMTHGEIALEVGRTRAAVQTRIKVVRKRSAGVDS